MMNRPFEHWIALVAGMLFVVIQHKEKPLISRMIIAAISGGVGYSQAPWLAEWTGRSEVAAVMLLTAFGYLALDAVGALVADREWLKAIIKSKVGK